MHITIIIYSLQSRTHWKTTFAGETRKNRTKKIEQKYYTLFTRGLSLIYVSHSEDVCTGYTCSLPSLQYRENGLKKKMQIATQQVHRVEKLTNAREKNGENNIIKINA